MKRAAAGLVICALVCACLAPALALLLESLRGPEGFSLRAYGLLLSEKRPFVLLLRSTLVAGGATALALVWGVAVGYAAARLRGWRAAAVELLSYVPLLVPSLVVALGWVRVLGPSGVVTRRLEALLGRAPFDLYTPAGAAFVLSLCTFPFVSILAAQGFRAIDPAALRAARLTAGRGRRLWHIWRPLLAPYLATGALLAFLVALADFGVPSALMVNVYPIEVFTRFSAYFDTPGALASCALPTALAGLLFVARYALVRRTPYETGGAATPSEGPVSRPVLALAALALVGSSVLPLVFLACEAQGAYAESLRIAGEQVLTSLMVALIGAGFLVAGGLAFALAYRRLGARARALSEAAILLSLIVPGTAVGLGILHLVTRDVWPFSVLYPGAAIVAYACTARFIAFPALVLAAGVGGLRSSLMHAAAAHGVSRPRAARHVLLPLAWPSFVAALTLSFVLCLGELSASVLVNPPGGMTLSVRLASLLHLGKDSVVASLCVMLSGLVLAVLALGLLIVGRPLRLRFQHADRAA